MLSTWFKPAELAGQGPSHHRKTSSPRLYVTSSFILNQSSSLSTSNHRSLLKFQKILSGATAAEGMAVPVRMKNITEELGLLSFHHPLYTTVLPFK